ncbi:hypothetical protein F638_2012 [Pseudomonas sp. LAIL14HWK12:I2]|jgi:hypothetical protein|uniref:hypothetical protein n=1 Tax=Pseudomonas sp. LAIL14HWK12:I2 TaxID=1265482 RepID=UPI001102C60D|nr:hypothetical protein [Pseudomonas sp. LAIL14HWK12:I2]TFA85729.1 hypothetical protein F638_2012 [Pseudomonas sp. LAIL14HWK12:I2]
MNFFKKLLVSLKRPKTEDVEPTPQPLEVQEPDIYDSITEAEAANLRKMAEKWGQKNGDGFILRKINLSPVPVPGPVPGPSA